MTASLLLALRCQGRRACPCDCRAQLLGWPASSASSTSNRQPVASQLFAWAAAGDGQMNGSSGKGFDELQAALGLVGDGLAAAMARIVAGAGFA